ncbi:diguanylate cyclase (GGDEF) domain-containing protein [Duganella sp. CF517]|uniref:putative bifunctional diguanylate cyclase/phosphodiesterase n=1 Tax=Duganella sp. CF517 TaxID=1881038 RepID=UPI0008CD7CE0|nr:EAL domain-containing protein [Duganella sp. CF517]SEO18910.1 diguanylate cyclase (GGDEF) domain-containing protein [Duganella sp. CF517]
MELLWPALIGIGSCLLALWYGEMRARVLRRRCARLQGALEAQRETEMRLDFIAHHDCLTGLPNRLQFQLRLEHGVAYARRHKSLLAVLFVDIDHFKRINDTLGHDAGDHVLVQFSQRLRQCVREVDTVARQGGDEFIVLLTELREADDALQVAGKIIAALGAPFAIHGQSLAVAASVGVAVYPDDDESIDELVEKADLAMYAAKQRGKGASVRFAPSMQVKAYSRLILETALRHALDHHEFVLAYQPRLDLRAQRITGVKALLRWNHPELGVVMPLDFLPVLEESALILPVGAWVLATAAAQARLWMDRGLPMTVSVHVSPRQFYQKDIAQTFATILAQAGVPGHLIELEIREGMLIDRNQNCEATLRQLKALGVRISISDFGTGYASLNYLRRFPVDVVKIDKSFIDELQGVRQPADAPGAVNAAKGSGDGAMVRAIIAMAHTLDMRVIAGGVETGEQLARLMAMDCDEAFGFCLGPAVPPGEVDTLLANRERRIELITS